MISEQDCDEYYQALLNKDSLYEGVFFVGVKTTGIFCRSSCPARKPKRSNCEFFLSAKDALTAAYRPCKRCQPLSHPSQTSKIISKLVEAVEAHPEKRWRTDDFRQLGCDESTARRQFKKRFGMTFVEYARARRMGLAMKQIKQGAKVIDSQVMTGYESSSGFNDAFSRIMGSPPSHAKATVLLAQWLDTPLGPMISFVSDQGLYLLEFVDRRGLEREVERLRHKLKATIIPGENPISAQLKQELEQYFSGTKAEFKTPLILLGTPFQHSVWQALSNIPIGETCSYSDIAESIDAPKAYRAVARANGANQVAIIIPCHRVININGEIGGYGGGIRRKQWLINHEKAAFQ